MRWVIVAALGLVSGLVAGLLLSEVIGVIGYLVTGRAHGIRFLPLILGAGCAIAAPIVDSRIRSRAHPGADPGARPGVRR